MTVLQSTWPANAAIVGLGVTGMGKIYGRTTADFAAEAIGLALDDAGLAKSDIDGLLLNGNGNLDMDPRLQFALGFEDLSMMNSMRAAGSTVGSMVQYASLALDNDISKRGALHLPEYLAAAPRAVALTVRRGAPARAGASGLRRGEGTAPHGPFLTR